MSELAPTAHGKLTAPSAAPAISAPIPQCSERGPGGRFLPGHTASRRHGLSGARIAQALIEQREDFERQSLSDDGADVPVRRASRHRYRARLHVQIEALSGALEHFGLFDRRNRLRVAWLQRLEGLIGLAARLDATLGDERRGKNISTLSASDYVEMTRQDGSDA